MAFQIFGKDIYWYGIIIAAGFLLAAAFCSWRAKDFGIKKDDFIWFGAYAAQCAYGVGTEPFTYIYSKDCNRDVVL